MSLTLLGSAGVSAQTLECAWSPPPGNPFPNHVHVIATVTIANLTDDNADGVTDALDFPDLVFPSTSEPSSLTESAVIRIVDGRCNGDGSMTTLADIDHVQPAADTDTTSAIAVGNLDPAAQTSERAPELVVVLRDGRMAALSRLSDDGTSWATRWTSAMAVDQGVGVQPSIADLDGDGSPEIVAGRAVFNGQTGAHIFTGTGGQGSDGLGAVSTVVDWDLNGEQDVVAGQTIFDKSGFQLITFPVADGYTAVANFNADAFPELVHVSGGVVRVFDQIGQELLNVLVPGGGRGGPPTIADFDGDGEPEIGVVAQSSYSVMDFDCLVNPLPPECQSTGVRWWIAIQEFTSGGQSSGAFDLDGDGAADIFFLDEALLRVLGGPDGQVLFSHAYPSTVTRLQYPTLADTDGNGRSQLVVPSAVSVGTPAPGGVQVWSSPDWPSARGIWNQYSYHVTNIDDAGQIPATPAYNWQDPHLNNFRANQLKWLFTDGFESGDTTAWSDAQP